MPHTSDMTTPTQNTGLRSRLLGRIAANPDEVWVSGDFADLANRPAIDKTLQRLVASGDLRRINRGLYDRPRMNDLTGRPTVPDYRAVTRRNQARTLIDGMTAANELGLTTAVPARIEVLVDARLRPIKLGNQEIHFRYAAPSRLYWAGRPAMRVVQALHWMQDSLSEDSERQRVEAKLRALFANPRHGQSIRDDLQAVSRPCRSGCRSSCSGCSPLPTRTRFGDDHRSSRSIAMTSPARHSACPVARPSTTSPLRFSISAWPM